MSELVQKASSTPSLDGNLYADDKYIVRNPRQIQLLLQALIDQRATVTAHPEGRENGFPTALLELDGDTLLLDGSPLAAVNRDAANAAYLLCFALVDKVTVRFRVPRLERIEAQGRTSFRASAPDEIHHLQRRDFYRLETPIGDSPYCALPLGDPSEPQVWRVVDISAGGIAVLSPPDTSTLQLQQRYRGCELRLPDTPAIPVSLIPCNQRLQKQPNGSELLRTGLRFDDLPRGADAMIQRYIFRVDRDRKARLNGDL